ncbi:Pyroglutamyl-peptidase 1 [Podospora conica]|nr:Pyroglutamyl-peptidase 1 [Schizothecium conicum]
MGSSAKGSDELTVLITGFAPFKSGFPINPSFEITRGLPDYLPKPSAKTKNPGPALPRVRLLVHPDPIKVCYTTVRKIVPELWHLDEDTREAENADDDEEGTERKPKIDIAIHIGMAGPDPHYSIERRGHRDGYAMRDVEGEFLKDPQRRAREGKDWIWDGMPLELLTDLDLDDVLTRWQANSPPGHNLRVSEDAGRYLCDFLYFSSLAHLTKAKQPRKVVFLHVPCDPSEQSITTGRELLLQLVRSLAQSEVTRAEKMQAHTKGKR